MSKGISKEAWGCLGVIGAALITGICTLIVGVPTLVSFFRPAPTVTTIPSAFVSQQTNVIVAPSLTFTPSTANVAQPTFTAIPLPTILPTTTPKPYYDQGESVVLKDGIYMYLSQDFLSAGGPCGYSDIAFGVKIVIENTINQQYLIRFNSSDFHAVDDLGNKYKLIAIGNNGDGFCGDPIGVPSEYTMS